MPDETPSQVPQPAAGPHAQKLEDSDPELLNVALTFLIGIADAVGRTNTRFQKQLDTMTREVQAVQSLGDALSQRFMSNTQLGAAPPLEGGHEALLAQLWERHAGAIDQQPLMRLFQQLSGSSGPEGESLKVREQEVREMAVVNQTMYSGLQASNELIHSLQVLSEVQSAALRLGSQYMGLFKNQIPPLPGSGS